MDDSKAVRESSVAQDIFFYAILGGVSFAFLAVFSYYTSPFTTCDNGADAAFFRLVGQGMTKGYLPYRDFFDMKGPFFFLIEYLGQLISYGRTGIFILQWINLFAAAVIICKILDLYRIANRIQQLCLLLPLACIAGVTFEGGNLTEEFSLAELLSCLLLCLLYFCRHSDAGRFWQHRFYWYAGAWYGFCFGLLLMIRITNAALICAMLLIIVFDLVKTKKYRQLAICASMFVLGLIISVLPAIIFFGVKGLLNDMFEAVFVLGFRYAGEKTMLQHIVQTVSGSKKQLLLLVVIPCVIPFLLRWRSWRERFLMLIGSVLTFFAIASGNNYPHYYTLTVPLLLLCEISIAETWHSAKGRKCIISTVLFGLMFACQLPLIGGRLYHSYEHYFHQERYSTQSFVRDVSSKIPEEDKESVFCYNLNPSWYTDADIIPCIKYCGWQNHYISIMPEIYEDFCREFQSDPPVWIVLPKQQGTLPAFLSKSLETEYQRYYENESYTLFHRSVD